MGRVPRPDRLAIVKEVEAQIFELLQERDPEELGRDDVLAVLARLDPPEAYLPEETGDEPAPAWMKSRPRAGQSVRRGDPKVAKVSGILGLVSLALVFLSPLGYGVAVACQSVAVFLALSGGPVLLAVMGGISAVVLGIAARAGSGWAVVGVVTGALSVLFCLAAVILMLLMGI
jgi:hypothetical protein